MKRMLQVQVGVLAIGTLFAWYTVVTDVLRFYDVEGTIFRIKDCAIPNPVTTPCFWGAWAFLLALVLSYRILTGIESSRVQRQKRLFILLIAGTIFAWSNNGYLLYKFYSNLGEHTIGCSGLLVTNPFTTPCSIGASLFLLALIVGTLVRSRLKPVVTPPGPQK